VHVASSWQDGFVRKQVDEDGERQLGEGSKRSGKL